MTITSPHNEHLKEIRKLNQRRRERQRAGRFVAEGEDLLAAADAAGWEALERYCAAGSGLAGTEVEPALLAAVSELGSGTRTLAVYAERWAPAPAGPLCVYLHGVHDPGNVGTILRSAEAFGAASVVLGAGTADPFGPKAVRASMGAIFAVAVARAQAGGGAQAQAGGGAQAQAGGGARAQADGGARAQAGGGARAQAGGATGELPRLPGRTVALAAEAATPLHHLALDGEVTLLIGAERTGLPDEILAAADHVARIPIATHSLNAAMAATVALYEASRMAR